MKATVLNTKFSTLFPHLPKTKVASFAHLSRITESFICNNPIRFPSNLRGKSTPFLYDSFICSTQNRNLQTEASRPLSGEIHVIVGPMFAGKTTTLLRRIQLENSNGRSVAIIKSSKDTRYGLDSVVTHDGMKFPCWALKNLSLFRQKFGLEAYEQLDVIGIDEAQFFEDLYDFCREAADHDGKTVIVAGLDGGRELRYGPNRILGGGHLMDVCCLYWRNACAFFSKRKRKPWNFYESPPDCVYTFTDRKKFGSVIDIIPLADSVTKLTARCEICGKRAFFTLRKTEETQVELIGGADVYTPVCRHHYVSGQVAVEAARHVLESQKLECGSYT